MTFGIASSASGARSCFCVGPQNGQPLCPCMMSNVSIEDGRYREIRDLGPVTRGKVQESREQEIKRLRKRLADLEGNPK